MESEAKREESRERSLPQTHEHFAPAIAAEDVPAFIYEYEQQGWEVAGVTTVHDPNYRLVVLKRPLTA